MMSNEIAENMLVPEDQHPKQKDQIVHDGPIELVVVPQDLETEAGAGRPGVSTDQSTEPAPDSRHLKGWRLYALIFGYVLLPPLSLNLKRSADSASASSSQPSRPPSSAHPSFPSPMRFKALRIGTGLSHLISSLTLVQYRDPGHHY